ncbi:MAG: putative Ig domain-containing protein, partial [Gammaproteobacteria bacterium]|nr:putative Ig domain-containing protein [Gammaproteobacteria bacterium]
MQTKDFPRTIYSALRLILAAFILNGCLADEPAEEVAGDPGPPAQNGPPQIGGNPAPEIRAGDVYSFSPSTWDPDGDALTFEIENPPSWATFETDTGNVSGQPTMGDIGLYSDILISVNDGQATASMPRFSISVDQVGTFSTTLSWTPPTENEDGTPLTD